MLLFSLTLFLCLVPPLAHAADGLSLKEITYTSAPGLARVVLEFTAQPEFTDGSLRDPDRVFLDLKACVLTEGASRDIKSAVAGGGLLKGMRAARNPGDVLRLVLDLDKFKGYKVAAGDAPTKLVIEVSGGEALPGPPAAPLAKRIVIDAGHGGHDPGAVGRGGLKEKDVALDIALMLGGLLKKEGGYEVFFTRTTDVFLELDERTVVANKKDADLFISVHANASRNRRARGVETYLLNWTNDAAAIKVAERENRIHMRREKERRDDLSVILASLELQNKRDESLLLAHCVQDSVVSSVSPKYRGVEDLGVKQALFYVLIGAKMPSVLAEVSFISNREEEKRLGSKDYRQRLAEGLAAGVKAYFEKSAPVQKVALR